MPRNKSFTASKLLKLGGAKIPAQIAFLLFLRFPQGSLVVHRFCTMRAMFIVAGRNNLAESVFIENV
jgi:hypothetical protein